MQIRNQLTITLCVPRRNRRVGPNIYIDFGCIHLTAGCTLKECLSSNYISFIRLSLILNTTLDILIAHKESYRCYSRRGAEGIRPHKGRSRVKATRLRSSVCVRIQWRTLGRSNVLLIAAGVKTKKKIYMKSKAGECKHFNASHFTETGYVTGTRIYHSNQNLFEPTQPSSRTAAKECQSVRLLKLYVQRFEEEAQHPPSFAKLQQRGKS